MARPSKLSIAERLEALRAQAARLEAEKAAEAAQKRPEFESLNSGLNTVKEARTVAMRGNGDHAQSFAARIEKHRLWIEQIEAEQNLSLAIVSAADNAVERIEAFLNENANSKAADLAERAANLAVEVERAYTDSIEDANMAVVAATEARKEFGEAITMPKKMRKAAEG